MDDFERTSFIGVTVLGVLFTGFIGTIVHDMLVPKHDVTGYVEVCAYNSGYTQVTQVGNTTTSMHIPGGWECTYRLENGEYLSRSSAHGYLPGTKVTLKVGDTILLK